jgi:hypothetical protein
MKRARFSEEQIIGILRENEAGAKAGRARPQARGFGGRDLRLEGQVRRRERVGGAAAGCQTARNRGSDSLLMKFRRRLLLVSHQESTPWDRPCDFPRWFRAAS